MPKTKKYKDKDKNKDKVDRSRFTRKNNFSRVVSSTIKNISFEKACSDFRALKNIDFSSKKIQSFIRQKLEILRWTIIFLNIAFIQK